MVIVLRLNVTTEVPRAWVQILNHERRYGAAPGFHTMDGRTPRELAEARGDGDMARLLQRWELSAAAARRAHTHVAVNRSPGALESFRRRQRLGLREDATEDQCGQAERRGRLGLPSDASEARCRQTTRRVVPPSALSFAGTHVDSLHQALRAGRGGIKAEIHRVGP